MPKWARDFLLLPLIVGVIVALFTVVLPRVLGDELELSYEIDGPTRYLSDPAVRNIEVSVNGKPVKDIVSYRVRIWNSGGTPIMGLPVRIVFNSEDPEMSILAISHNTNPEYEFGDILPLESAANSKRFQYELLNGGDQDIVTLIANVAVPISLYTKAKGLTLVRIKPDEDLTFDEFMKGPAFGVLSALIAFFAFALQRFVDPFDNKIRQFVRRVLVPYRKDKHNGG